MTIRVEVLDGNWPWLIIALVCGIACYVSSSPRGERLVVVRARAYIEPPCTRTRLHPTYLNLRHRERANAQREQEEVRLGTGTSLTACAHPPE